MAYNPSLYSTVPAGQPMYQNIQPMQMIQQTPLTQPAYQTPYIQPPSLTAAYTQGEVGARSYLVAPNNTVVLLDSDSIDTENPVIYIKATGADGKPLPMRRITGTASYPNEQGLFISNQVETEKIQVDLSPYSTKEELQREIANLNERLGNIDETILELNTSISGIDERLSNMFNAASNQFNGKNSSYNHQNNGNKK